MKKLSTLGRRPSLFASMVIATGFVACNQIFGISLGQPEASGTGGRGGSASTGGSTSTASSTGAGGATSSSGSTSSSGTASSTSSTSSTSSSGTGGSTSTSDSGADTGTGTSPVSLQDCVLLLHMDEPTWSGQGSVKDSSGQGNNGSPMGSAQTTPNGKFGRAALFDGNGYIDVPDSASLHPTTAVTYAAWIYPTGLVALNDAGAYPYGGIVSKRVSYGVDTAFTMFIWTNNNLWADIQDNRFYSNAVFTNDQWYHVAVVFDGQLSNATIYVNGAFDSVSATDNTSFDPHTADLTVGFLPQGGAVDPSAYFIGRIDEVAVWNRALGASEIAALYQATEPL